MNTAELKKEIETLAADENITFIEACQAFQAAAASLKNEAMIKEVHNLKMAEVYKNNPELI